MALMTERAILSAVFGDHAVERMEAHAPYYLIDSSDVLTAVNDQGRCALSELAEGGDFLVATTPHTEPVMRLIVGRRPELVPVANDVAQALRSLVVANDNGRLRTDDGVARFLDGIEEVSDRFATMAIAG